MLRDMLLKIILRKNFLIFWKNKYFPDKCSRDKYLATIFTTITDMTSSFFIFSAGWRQEIFTFYLLREKSIFQKHMHWKSWERQNSSSILVMNFKQFSFLSAPHNNPSRHCLHNISHIHRTFMLFLLFICSMTEYRILEIFPFIWCCGGVVKDSQILWWRTTIWTINNVERDQKLFLFVFREVWVYFKSK